MAVHGAGPVAGATRATQAGASQAFNTEQLDALLAPIALYPDTLLTQILMASTFPLQVVEAARWVEEPGNKPLSGDASMTALASQPWDPSVKSLVPFPQVLAMMNADLGWMQQLGYAFADQRRRCWIRCSGCAARHNPMEICNRHRSRLCVPNSRQS